MKLSKKSNLRVPVTTLDALLSQSVERIALLKIDVEGYEKYVLAGGSVTLGRTDCLYFEVWDAHCSKYGYSSVEILDSLRARGFTLVRLSDNNSVISVPQQLHSDEQCERDRRTGCGQLL